MKANLINCIIDDVFPNKYNKHTVNEYGYLSKEMYFVQKNELELKI